MIICEYECEEKYMFWEYVTKSQNWMIVIYIGKVIDNLILNLDNDNRKWHSFIPFSTDDNFKVCLKYTYNFRKINEKYNNEDVLKKRMGGFQRCVNDFKKRLNENIFLKDFNSGKFVNEKALKELFDKYKKFKDMENDEISLTTLRENENYFRLYHEFSDIECKKGVLEGESKLKTKKQQDGYEKSGISGLIGGAQLTRR